MLHDFKKKLHYSHIVHSVIALTHNKETYQSDDRRLLFPFPVMLNFLPEAGGVSAPPPIV